MRQALPLLALAAPSGALAQTPDDNTLVVAQSSDSSSLDPASLSSIASANIARHLWGTLLEITPEGDIEPYLAESHTVSESGTEISFTLRDGLTCHDGEALTAEDVVYTFERAADPENACTGNTPGFIFDSLGYAGARVDGELTATAQRAIVDEMLEVFYNDPPWLILYFQPNFYGVSSRLEWEPRLDGRIDVLGARLP